MDAEQIAIVEGYPSPLNDLPMALALRSIAQAIRSQSGGIMMAQGVMTQP